MQKKDVRVSLYYVLFQQQQHMDLAVKNLQLIIFHEEMKHYQTMNKVITN